MIGGYLVGAPSKSKFLSRWSNFRSNYLQYYRNTLVDLIEVAPNRVMWGTDMVHEWNTDPDVYEKLMSYTQAVMEPLSADQRAAYTHGNAVAFAEPHFGL